MTDHELTLCYEFVEVLIYHGFLSVVRINDYLYSVFCI